LGQVIGWDRLPETEGSTTTIFRVKSTIGQHLFLGDYLALLTPLAAARYLSSGSATRPVPYSALGAGALWVAGVLPLVWLASTVPPSGWLLLPMWGLVLAVAWDRIQRAAGPAPIRGIPPAPLFGALGALQIGVVFLSGGRAPFLALIVALAIVGEGL